MQRFVRSRRVGIPVLMYHRVSSAPEPGVHPYFRINTSPAAFNAQLRLLKANGYATISLDQARKLLATSATLDRNYAVITFDDGYRDFYTDALPLLEQYRFNATVFLPTRYIAGTRQSFHGVECLTWQEVRELSTRGIVFGSHTVSHPQLATVERVAVRQELAASKARIEDCLGVAVRSFSYPFRFPETNKEFTGFLERALEETGYSNGVSTVVGTATAADNRFFLKRLPVNSDDDDSLFQWKLRGAYDWIHAPQYWFKRIKSWRPIPARQEAASVGSRGTVGER